MRRVLVGCALLAAAGAAAGAGPQELTVNVRVSGAVERAGTYHHPADGAHRCWPALEIPPLPTPGARFGQTPFRVDFDSAARPPGNSFELAIRSFDAAGFSVAMTAGGHYWQGDSATLPGATLQAQAGGMRGRFRLAGLRAADTPGLLTVEGDWTCPDNP